MDLHAVVGESVRLATNVHGTNGSVETPVSISSRHCTPAGVYSDGTAPTVTDGMVGHYVETVDTTGLAVGTHKVTHSVTLSTGEIQRITHSICVRSTGTDTVLAALNDAGHGLVAIVAAVAAVSAKTTNLPATPAAKADADAATSAANAAKASADLANRTAPATPQNLLDAVAALESHGDANWGPDAAPAGWLTITQGSLDTGGTRLGLAVPGAGLTAYLKADIARFSPISGCLVASDGTWALHLPSSAAVYTLVAEKVGYIEATAEVTIR